MEVSNQAFLKKVRSAGAGSVITRLDSGVISLTAGDEEFSAPCLFLRQDRETYYQLLDEISEQHWVSENGIDIVRA